VCQLQAEHSDAFLFNYYHIAEEHMAILLLWLNNIRYREVKSAATDRHVVS
jgi:hypothetical protein